MFTFSIAFLALILGYFTYGKFISRVFKPNKYRLPPSLQVNDGIDFIPMPAWKLFMIQFLNIAGLGPIFGAIMGAQFGTASYQWIVLGTIFAGAVHDYASGFISIRNKGESLPENIGRYLGPGTRKTMLAFCVLLLIMVGAVFVSGPAELLANMTPNWMNGYFWMVVIFAYYMLATMLPIDKIIGKVYPLFAIALLFMAFGLLVMLYVKQPDLPEIWNGLGTKYDQSPIFPMMFISIACGAISGFHATQSPLAARCLKNERLARPIFYGAMVTEGIVALIWAAVATAFFGENGITHIDPTTGTAVASSGAYVAQTVSYEWLGTFGGALAILGIVCAPITSGDTALRSARLIVADALHIDQSSVKKRFAVCIPIFLCSAGVLVWSLGDADGFKILWRYFSWSNQVLSVFTLWAITVYLTINQKPWIITLLPAIFMTSVCTTYVFYAPECLGMDIGISCIMGCLCGIMGTINFFVWKKRHYSNK